MGHVRTGPHRHTCHVTCQPAMARNLTFCLPPLPKTTTTAAAATTTTTVVATAAAATATYSHCLHCYPYIYHFAAHRATCLPVRDWARHTAASRGTPPFVASLQPFLAWYRKKNTCYHGARSRARSRRSTGRPLLQHLSPTFPRPPRTLASWRWLPLCPLTAAPWPRLS